MMAFQSVDSLQKALAETVFGYAQDTKKAAGRALGTLVEVITFYLLQSWGLAANVAIERPLPEYPDGDITHNVEYSLHPSVPVGEVTLPDTDLPISSRKVLKALNLPGSPGAPVKARTNQLLTSRQVLRNACAIADVDGGVLVATMSEYGQGEITVVVNRLSDLPFAVAECKRVGIEEGAGKGPQTIEKAKQGAYVARSVSALQKIRLSDGGTGGVMHRSDGSFVHKPYEAFLEEVIASDDADLLRRFVLTVGVVSNHGNWFTSDNHNKELRVLASAYTGSCSSPMRGCRSS